jgi:hypothetical protein
MKKSLIYLSLLSLFVFNTVSAKSPESGRQRVALEKSPINFKVVFGEKETSMQLVSSPKVLLTYSDNQGKQVQRELSSKDYVFVAQKVNVLKGESKKRESCMREYISIQNKQKTHSVCLNAKTDLAKNMRTLVNTLSVYF